MALTLRRLPFPTYRAVTAFPELGRGSRGSKPSKGRCGANLKRKRKPWRLPVVRRKKRTNGQLQIPGREAISRNLAFVSQPMRLYNNASAVSVLRGAKMFKVRKNPALMNAPISCNPW